MAGAGAAWIGLTGVVVGSVIGFVTTWFTNRDNLKHLREQLETQRKDDFTRLKRERLEELFVAVTEWANTITGIYMSLVGVMKSGRSLDQHYEFMAESGEDRHYQFARLEMIVNIYGDSVRKEYDDAIKARTKLNEIAAEFEQTYRTGGTGTSYLKGYVAAQQNFEKAVGNLTGSIAKGANQLSID